MTSLHCTFSVTHTTGMPQLKETYLFGNVSQRTWSFAQVDHQFHNFIDFFFPCFRLSILGYPFYCVCQRTPSKSRYLSVTEVEESDLFALLFCERWRKQNNHKKQWSKVDIMHTFSGQDKRINNIDQGCPNICHTSRYSHVYCVRNVVAHGDAMEGKWRRNWRMEWVASTLHTTSEHGVSSITNADAHTSAASSRLNWLPPPI